MDADKDEDTVNISETSAIRRIDLATIFPAKGDSRRPPEWLGRGLFYTVIAIFLGIFVWNSWPKISGVVFYVIVALFISLALEPLIIRLVKHGWKRGAAAGVTIIGFVVVVIAFFSVFGIMLVQQATKLIATIPNTYNDIRNSISSWTGYELPKMNDLSASALRELSRHGQGYLGQLYSTVSSVVSGLMAILTILLVAYYISAAGPKLRRSVCKWIPRRSQRKFIVIWTTVQGQISNYLYSRFILAILNGTFLALFMILLKIPYWLPLAIWCGLVSQFIPTIGTYLGGVIPIISAWGTNGWQYAVYLLIYITVYQQIENMLFQPRVSKDTMDLNPAVAFLSVFFFGGLFGALGAFLALPITASIQALLQAYMRSYDLIDSDLMDDPKPVKKSGLVTGAEVLEKNVINPLSEKLPRTSRGSSSHVMAQRVMDLRRKVEVKDEEASSKESFEEGSYPVYKTMAEEDQSQTVAIPQNWPQRTGKKIVGVEEEPSATESSEEKSLGEEPSKAEPSKAEPSRGKPSEEEASAPADSKARKNKASGSAGRGPRGKWTS